MIYDVSINAILCNFIYLSHCLKKLKHLLNIIWKKYVVPQFFREK